MGRGGVKNGRRRDGERGGVKNRRRGKKRYVACMYVCMGVYPILRGPVPAGGAVHVVLTETLTDGEVCVSELCRC